MTTRQTPYVPLLNPDRRPLPSGWTQHYDASRKLWVYLDMSALPPRATLTHPTGPSIRVDALSRGNAHTRAFSAGEPQLSSGALAKPINVPYHEARGHRERQEKTLAQQLYSSALPAVKKVEGADKSLAMRTTIALNEESAPAYGSNETSGFSTAASSSLTKPSFASSSGPSYVTPAKTLARRPLPTPPSSSLPTETTAPIATIPSTRTGTRSVCSAYHWPQSLLAPLAYSLQLRSTSEHNDNVAGSDLRDSPPQPTRRVADPSLDPPITLALRVKPPSYSTAIRPLSFRPKLEPRTSSSSFLPTLPTITGSSRNSSVSHDQQHALDTLTPSASCDTASTNAPSPQTPNSDPLSLSSHSDHTPSKPLTPYQPLTLTLPDASLSISSTATTPSSVPTTLQSSPPTTPEPSLPSPFSPNRRPPRDYFAPPQIVAIVTQPSPTGPSHSRLSTSTFDATTLYNDPSNFTSRLAAAASHASPELLHSDGRPEAGEIPPALSTSPSPMTSRSSVGLHRPSNSFSASATSVASQVARPAPVNRDPDLVETPPPGTILPSTSMTIGETTKNRLRKLGAGFSKNVGKKSSGVMRTLKAGMSSSADLRASSGVKIDAEAVGREIDDGIRSVLSAGEEMAPANDHTPSPTVSPQPTAHSQVPAEDKRIPSPLGVALPLQSQNTDSTLRSTPPQTQKQTPVLAPVRNTNLSPLPYPLGSTNSFTSPQQYPQQPPVEEDYNKIVEQMQAFNRTAAASDTNLAQRPNFFHSPSVPNIAQAIAHNMLVNTPLQSQHPPPPPAGSTSRVTFAPHRPTTPSSGKQGSRLRAVMNSFTGSPKITRST
ncbi:hypothetical protein DFP72DRAFT_866461 [Ephemerocybe angulata]|uniref:Uncharacterized protein n=1 Tax=Ephemerocybe angulata TaxID=980116 RepID=A0A8H6IKN0_9AGAR|nr:hypothetical protein DFP72DRAFT_866461 [Tulosesus angulatus]